ncbi:MAG: undecaprenyl diphosphate synthase family protein [Pseudomonadota bacterium]
MRISNFLLWHMAYSELEFVDALWPDFTSSSMAEIIGSFKLRDRRFGRIKMS